LLAAESRAIARLLDWGEVKLRAGGSSAEKRWRRLAVGQKIAVTGLIASLGVALAYASYRVLL